MNFRNDDSGAIALISGLMFFVLIAGAGAALDVSNTYHVQSQMQIAADAAALAAAQKRGSISNGALTQLAQEVYDRNDGPPGMTLVVTPGDDGVLVTVNGTSRNMLLPIVGKNSFDIEVVSEVLTGTGPMEIALVLDNTGSMQPHVAGLRNAAKEFVDTLYNNGSPSTLRMAVVPYAGTVNIGNGATQMAWMDVAGNADYHGKHFRGHTFANTIDPCTPTPSNSPAGPDTSPGNAEPGTDRNAAVKPGTIGQSLRRFAGFFGEAFFGGPAHAADASDVPAPYGIYRECSMNNPPRVNLFTDVLGPVGIGWKGCVEARPAPYDVTDDAPTTSTADTMFVPWVWPDEPDDSVGAALNFTNNYMDDKAGDIPQVDTSAPMWTYNSSWLGGRIKAIHKYNNPVSVNTDTSAPVTRGPNQGCPDPILPLTNSQSTIISKIDNLQAWQGGGTNAALGVVWGWRTLSPGAPFTEGAAYGNVTKVMVLMTDGMNALEPHGSTDINSEWSAYGYLRNGRLGKYQYSELTQHINNRMLATCVNAKAEGVQIFAVMFGVTDPATRSFYEQCSSDSTTHVFSASTVDELESSFRNIGKHLSETRLVR